MKKPMLIPIILTSFLLISCNNNQSAKPSTNVSSISSNNDIESIKEFDTKSWTDFKEIYTNHNKIIETIENDDDLAIYNSLDKLESFFKEKPKSLNYGKSDAEKDYLNDLSDLSLSGSSACSSLKEYINTKEIKYLSDAKNALDKSKEKITLITLNREKILKKANYNEDEIKNTTDAALSDLSFENNSIDNFDLNEIFLDEDKVETATENTTNSDTNVYLYYGDDYSSIVGTYKTVKSSNANVRKGPGFDYGIYYHLSKGDSVYISAVEYADERLWCYIGDGWLSINTLNGAIN